MVDGNGPSSWLVGSCFPRLENHWLNEVGFRFHTSGGTKGEIQRCFFSPGIGTLKHFRARITVSSGAHPKFHWPRLVPFALKPVIKTELDCLGAAGVIKKVSQSDWAAPIVAVPKSDFRIWICGDYKVTVNPYIEVDTHLLSKPEDLFASLSGGQKLIKIDLSQAYDSHKFVVINTHGGLYEYTRMPLGNFSAPAIFKGWWTVFSRPYQMSWQH